VAGNRAAHHTVSSEIYLFRTIAPAEIETGVTETILDTCFCQQVIDVV